MKKRLRVAWRWLAPRTAPGLLIGLAIGIGVWTAARAGSQAPPSSSEFGIYALVSSLLSIFGGWSYARIGRTSPEHARSAVRRLLSIGRMIRAARDSCSDGNQSLPQSLTEVEWHVKDAMMDWYDVHKEALRDVLNAEGMGEGDSDE
jgi:hypothetical protein